RRGSGRSGLAQDRQETAEMIFAGGLPPAPHSSYNLPMPPPAIFDRALLRARRVRAARDPVTFLVDRVADDLAVRLSTVLRQFDHAADLGTPTDAVRRRLA